MSAFFKKFEQLIKYCAIGCTGAALDFCLYILLENTTPFHYLFINAFSTSCGIVNNFFLNAYFNFNTKDHCIRRLLSFFLVGMIGMGITSVLLYLLIDNLHLSPVISKSITILVVTGIQFLLNKFVTFRKKEEKCVE